MSRRRMAAATLAAAMIPVLAGTAAADTAAQSNPCAGSESRDVYTNGDFECTADWSAGMGTLEQYVSTEPADVTRGNAEHSMYFTNHSGGTIHLTFYRRGAFPDGTSATTRLTSNIPIGPAATNGPSPRVFSAYHYTAVRGLAVHHATDRVLMTPWIYFKQRTCVEGC
ncbi:hypothetical protein [Actinokineospora sp.]|uniref:hypothetical protein n=1 Tax=Actinokineospora sp. TaxID=1872133 RepID=UPI00403819A7